MTDKINKTGGKIWWLWFGFIVTLGYAVLVAVFIQQYEAGFIERIVQLNLNEIGDFLAGIFAPLAFLWLFVATMMQSEELKLQRKELAENREVMQEQADAAKAQVKFVAAQTEAMEQQTALLLKQDSAAAETSKRNYKLNLFDARFRIFKQVDEHCRYISANGHRNDHDQIFSSLAVESHFVFDRNIYEYLTEISRLIIRSRALNMKTSRVNAQYQQDFDKRDELGHQLAEIDKENFEITSELKQMTTRSATFSKFEPFLNVTDVSDPRRDNRGNDAVSG